MKRLLTILAAVLLLTAMFTACGTKEDAPAEKSVDLQALMSDINSTYGLSDMNTVEDVNGLRRYYQIPTDEVARFAAEYTSASSSYTEVILVESTDETAAADVKTKLEDHLRKQLSDAKSYHADQVNMLKACEPKQSGVFVYLVIGDDQEEIVSMIEDAIG